MSSPFYWACPGKDTSTLPPNVPHGKANKVTKFQLRGFRAVAISTPNGLERNEVRVCFRFCKVFQHLLPPHSAKLDTFHFHHAVPKHCPGLWAVVPVPSWIDWLLRSCSSRCVLTWHHVSCVAKKSLSSYLWWTDIMGFSPQAAAPQKAKGAFRPTEFVEAPSRKCQTANP